jgi:hypothetical protein
MSQTEVVEAVEGLVATFNGRDRDGWRSSFSAEADLALTLGLGTDSYRGQDGAGEWFDSMPLLWSEFTVTLRNVDVIDTHTAIAELHTTGRGTRPGLKADANLFLGVTTAGEKVTRFVVSNDRDRVLADLARPRLSPPID